ncbi:MAG TPA: tetratricopeptide repeat protein [Gemmatimonadales bacterium]|jgi:Flp pilus assembly protein TadD|nr:tetratricopeptide repeat protein [Gemmatimonadales bacterium]
MRRLRNSRSPEADEAALEGFDRADLEGDAIGPVIDELPWLRPFGADVPGHALRAGLTADEAESDRVPRRARELVGAGRRLDALLLIRRYLDDAPKDAAVRTLLAELLDDGGDPDAALDELSRALDHATEPVPVLVHRGAILARRGRTAEAEQDLRDAIRRSPSHAPAHFHLGLTLLRRGRGADAAAALRESLQHAPDDADATYYLGEALQVQGDLAGALTALERAAALAPEQPRTYKLMGRLLDRLGRTDLAMAMHKKAREAGIR